MGCAGRAWQREPQGVVRRGSGAEPGAIDDSTWWERARSVRREWHDDGVREVARFSLHRYRPEGRILPADGRRAYECHRQALTVPLYLPAECVAESLRRLQQSSAQSRLCEFLIGLRTLALSGTDHVQVAESIPQFVQALDELTACVPADMPTTFDGEPYINPFGTARGQATGRAYKSRKFPSNGPSNT